MEIYGEERRQPAQAPERALVRGVGWKEGGWRCGGPLYRTAACDTGCSRAKRKRTEKEITHLFVMANEVAWVETLAARLALQAKLVVDLRD